MHDLLFRRRWKGIAPYAMRTHFGHISFPLFCVISRKNKFGSFFSGILSWISLHFADFYSCCCCCYGYVWMVCDSLFLFLSLFPATVYDATFYLGLWNGCACGFVHIATWRKCRFHSFAIRHYSIAGRWPGTAHARVRSIFLFGYVALHFDYILTNECDRKQQSNETNFHSFICRWFDVCLLALSCVGIFTFYFITFFFSFGRLSVGWMAGAEISGRVGPRVNKVKTSEMPKWTGELGVGWVCDVRCS